MKKWILLATLCAGCGAATPLPRMTYGFPLGGTAADARARCVAAGGRWSSMMANCDRVAAPGPGGADARIGIILVDDRVVEVLGFLDGFDEEDYRAVAATFRLVEADLSARFGPALTATAREAACAAAIREGSDAGCAFHGLSLSWPVVDGTVSLSVDHDPGCMGPAERLHTIVAFDSRPSP